ncbi:MAG: TonB-dependent receptor [Chitinophagaceae bacterium]|nr:TonB-dependent receptor [Chitinophagaceae bacterium]
MLKRIIPVLGLLLAIPAVMLAQVTTSTITGNVKAANGESLVGATVTATHTPSGTVYATIAKKDGAFNLPGLRIGGPYTVKIDFVGQKSQVFENIFLQLGEAYNINAVLGADEKELSGVVLTGTRGRRAGADKGGMSTVINNRLIATLPTLNRSITDFTRVTPQASGNSFAGRDARFNNITIDGANLNNNFGLSTDPLPGAGNNPVSLDAIDEVSVSIAPFDVRQGNFTGGNIAATTKSGTNTFHGTAYHYWQNDKLIGKNAAGGKATSPVFESKIYGGSLGGPIIKNKLFFFINGEFEQKPPAAGITWTPKGGSGVGNISDVPVDSMKRVADYLINNFGFDPGVYDNFPAFKNENYKILGKLDWNISKVHKLTLKYSEFKGTQDFQPSQSGGINGANTAGIVTYASPRFGKTNMGFSGVTYVQEDKVRSGAFELNSNFRGKFANQLLATVTKINSDKDKNGATFPFVEMMGITSGSTINYISVGNEPFNGNNNKVLNDIYTITDNFTLFTGKHTLTAGLSYEYQKVGNMFMAGNQGYYVYRNVDDFVNNRAPQLFSITYSLIKGQDAVWSADLKIGQLAAYFQDEINVNPKLKVTLGIRMDKPVYPEQPLENPAITSLVLADIDGTPTSYTTGKWPKTTPLFSPRVGFRWDAEGDKSMILRGGTGIYTGRIPFVYLTNVPSNSGMYQFGRLITPSTAGTSLSNFLFNPSGTAYNPFYNTNLPANLFPTTAGAAAPSVFAVTSKDFKFPQIWRTNIAVDKQLDKTWKLSLEAMYTKDINAVYMFNANQKNPDGTVTTGGFTRGRYSSTSSSVRRINTTVNNAIVLDNTSKGSSFVLTAGLSKTFSKGWLAALAYNYTYAVDVTANPGSQAASVWGANATSGTQNTLELAYTNFAVPHRIVGNVSYHFEYLKHLGTTISFFYEGRTGGTNTYVYSGDLNNDGNTTSDLMYIPKSATNTNEIQFVSTFAYPNGVTYTAAQMAEIFENFIQQEPYLRKHRGQVAERNGAKLPWYNRIDAKVVQDIFTNVGKNRHTIQLTADIFNVLNLVNSDWGVRKIATALNPLTLVSVTNNIPTFRLSTFNNAPITSPYQNNISTSTTWAMQIGVRYMF